MIQNQFLWTALVTPMEENGAIDFTSLENLAVKQQDAGNGILLIGSTGEGLALHDAEKREVVEYVASLGLEVPLMVGVGGMNHSNQTEWIEHCNSLPVDAFLLVTPLYAKPGPVGQFQWFKTLLDASEKPCMLYNIPSRTGSDLDFSVAEKLEKHSNFWSVKEASGSISTYRMFRERIPTIPLYSGDDALLAAFRPFGCSGLVSVASNVWPEATRLYAERCLAGETDSLFPLWDRAVRALFSASNPIPVKKLLHIRGDITANTLRPPLTEEELNETSVLTTLDNEITQWYENNR